MFCANENCHEIFLGGIWDCRSKHPASHRILSLSLMDSVPTEEQRICRKCKGPPKDLSLYPAPIDGKPSKTCAKCLAKEETDREKRRSAKRAHEAAERLALTHIAVYITLTLIFALPFPSLLTVTTSCTVTLDESADVSSRPLTVYDTGWRSLSSGASKAGNSVQPVGSSQTHPAVIVWIKRMLGAKR